MVSPPLAGPNGRDEPPAHGGARRPPWAGEGSPSMPRPPPAVGARHPAPRRGRALRGEGQAGRRRRPGLSPRGGGKPRRESNVGARRRRVVLGGKRRGPGPRVKQRLPKLAQPNQGKVPKLPRQAARESPRRGLATSPAQRDGREALPVGSKASGEEDHVARAQHEQAVEEPRTSGSDDCVAREDVEGHVVVELPGERGGM